MSYRPSKPLERWQTTRAETIAVLASGHAGVGRVRGPGRPLNVSKPLAHAYVITMVSEFQGFVRDLHDLTAQRLVTMSGAGSKFSALLVEGLTKGRGIDRGNAIHTTIKADFGRLGLSPFDLDSRNPRWKKGAGDQEALGRLIELRNLLGHGNETGLDRLLATTDVRDTVSWARKRLPVLNRYSRALDQLAWDHLRKITGKDPWQ